MRQARALLGLLSLLPKEGNCIGGGGGGGMTKNLERHYFLRLQKPFSKKVGVHAPVPGSYGTDY